ncbi:MAG: DUF2147 domain-containing protein [Pseudomonadota bacterium]
MDGMRGRGGRFWAALLVWGSIWPYPALAEDPDPVFGRWLVESGKAVIEIYPCGEMACGKLVWLANPNTTLGIAKTDGQNEDPALRLRPLCGLELVTGLRQKVPGEWSSGEIYSTRDGQTYGLDVTIRGQDQLDVRGYLGLAILGSTQTWRRDTAPERECAPEAVPPVER